MDNNVATTKQYKPGVVSVAVGIFCGLFAVLMLYLIFSTKNSESDLWSFIVTFIFFGMASFLSLSPWKQINFLVGGISFFAFGIWLVANQFTYQYGDYLSLIWGVVSMLIGLSLSLRFFDTNLSKFIYKIGQTKTFKLTGKIIFWSVIVIAGLLVISGLISLLAGLSAVTIIIILLVLILLK